MIKVETSQGPMVVSWKYFPEGLNGKGYATQVTIHPWVPKDLPRRPGVFGVSYLRPKDRFNKAMARGVAFSRALQEAVMTPEDRELLKAAFSAVNR